MCRIRDQRMKKSPASIERNAPASAEQSTSENGNAAEIIFHSKPTENQTTKEKQTMKTTKPRAVRQYEAIEAHGKNLLAIFPRATERDPIRLCKKLRRLETKASAIALRLCNGPEYSSPEEVDALTDAILAKVNALLGNVNEYQPKTGARCTCRPGIARDNCAACEGTGRKIDFAAIRNRPALVPVFINRDPRGYALKIKSEYMAGAGWIAQLALMRDWGGYGIIAPEITGD